MFLLDHSANVMIFTHMSHQLNELHNLHVDTTCTCNKPKKTCEIFFHTFILYFHHKSIHILLYDNKVIEHCTRISQVFLE